MSGKMSKQSAFSKGLNAEYTAKAYLMDKGFVFLEHRYKTRWGELDLVMHQAHTLVFFEVKYRPTLATGLSCITPRQRQRLWHAAEHFLQCYEKIEWETLRFDLIIVSSDVGITHLEHILSIE